MDGQIPLWEPEAPPRSPRLSQPRLETPDGHVFDDEGLLAREIRRHSLQKSYRVSRFAHMVSVAVGRKLPVYWVEFFAGPGRLAIRGTKGFIPGSPMQALSVPHPFVGYFFNDRSQECCDCLRQRTRGMHGVHINRGDANHVDTMDALERVVPKDGLVIAYLDPQGLDLEMGTIRALAFRFKRLDLLINLPVSGIVRNPTCEKTARVLGHPAPGELMHGNHTHNIREYFRDQLEDLGYARDNQTAFEVRQSAKKALLYDLVVAGRHPITRELFERASDVGLHGERRLRAV